MSYLEVISAPDLYFQYTILRMSQKIEDLKLYDIAMALTNSDRLPEDETILKLVSKIQEYIVHTSEENLLGTGTNLQGLCYIYCQIQAMQKGSPRFWQKMEHLLAKDISAKESVIDLYLAVTMLDAMGKQRCSKPEIWQELLSDFEQHM